MTPANDNRPAGFDAALVAYLPMLRRKARMMTRDAAKAEELMQETAFAILRRASACRMETFKVWAQGVMDSTDSSMRKQARTKMRFAPEVSIDAMAGNDEVAPLENRCAQLRVAADQIEKLELAQVVEVLRRTPNGTLLLRRAAGVELHEIGDELGIGKEAVRQREERARNHLRAA